MHTEHKNRYLQKQYFTISNRDVWSQCYWIWFWWKGIFYIPWLQSQVQRPLWTCLLTLTIWGWWYSAFELHNSTTFMFSAIFKDSATCRVKGSLNFCKTTHLKFSGSPLCLRSWWFLRKLFALPFWYSFLWLPDPHESRVYIFLLVSPK